MTPSLESAHLRLTASPEEGLDGKRPLERAYSKVSKPGISAFQRKYPRGTLLATIGVRPRGSQALSGSS
jgi:hypothetical protein